jgi:drug/metabolite transporter (DMT)-like permease
MNWVPFALLAAFSLSTADALSKRAFRHADDFTVVWVREAYALPFVVIAFLFVPVPALDATFFLAVGVLVPLEVVSLVLYVKAIRVSPLSLTVPFMAFSPVFIIFAAFFILGEVPDVSGIAGIFFVALGAYLLNASELKAGLLGPLRAIRKETGSILMLIVAFIYSITSTLGKVAVLHSEAIFFGFFYPFVLTAALSVIALRRGGIKEALAKPKVFPPP